MVVSSPIASVCGFALHLSYLRALVHHGLDACAPPANYPSQIALLTLSALVSGLSAAHTIYLAGGNVVVLDKQGE